MKWISADQSYGVVTGVCMRVGHAVDWEPASQPAEC
eukprot:COSAG02_NODE_7116_length_3177_cov_1.863873_4_plen_36_part_00